MLLVLLLERGLALAEAQGNALTIVLRNLDPPPARLAGIDRRDLVLLWGPSPNPLACFIAVGLPMPIEISLRSNSTRAVKKKRGNP